MAKLLQALDIGLCVLFVVIGVILARDAFNGLSAGDHGAPVVAFAAALLLLAAVRLVAP